MSSRLNPYVSFRDNARQAMEFYKDVFGGALTISTFGDLGAPAADPDQIMHAMLETDSGFTLMASDTPPEVDYQPGTNVSISLSGDDVDELHGYWTRLSEGATVAVPMAKQAWGDEFGMCVDRFGICWLVNISQPAG